MKGLSKGSVGLGSWQVKIQRYCSLLGMNHMRMSNIDKNREIFTKVWNVYRTYGNPQNDSEWEVLTDKLSELRKAYPTELTKDLILAVLKEVEREY